jgi:hypothetical protein
VAEQYVLRNTKCWCALRISPPIVSQLHFFPQFALWLEIPVLISPSGTGTSYPSFYPTLKQQKYGAEVPILVLTLLVALTGTDTSQLEVFLFFGELVPVCINLSHSPYTLKEQMLKLVPEPGFFV